MNFLRWKKSNKNWRNNLKKVETNLKRKGTRISVVRAPRNSTLPRNEQWMMVNEKNKRFNIKKDPFTQIAKLKKENEKLLKKIKQKQMSLKPGKKSKKTSKKKSKCSKKQCKKQKGGFFNFFQKETGDKEELKKLKSSYDSFIKRNS